MLEQPGDLRNRYLEKHPYASYYADFTDFGFWRINVESVRYVGGFGHMSWVDADGYAEAEVDPLSEVAGGVVEHMNDDHRDANLLYVQVLAGLDDATDAKMVGIDRYGVTLTADTPAGPRMARLPFANPLTDSDQARPAVIELLGEARAQASS
jgi:putative heme iron utilization protein